MEILESSERTSSGSENASNGCVATTESSGRDEAELRSRAVTDTECGTLVKYYEPNRYQKYHKIIKDILFIPVSIVGFCIVIVSVGIMAILGGFVLIFYIIKGFFDAIVNDGARIYKYIFETDTEPEIVELRCVVDVHIIDVKVVDIISENNINHSDALPVAIAINKRQIIPL